MPRTLRYGAIILPVLAQATAWSNPPSNAYVGYTAPKAPPVFITCKNAYADPLLPPNIQATVNAFAQGNLISLFHFAIQHNNRNGTVPIPANHVVAQRVGADLILVSPCSTVPVRVLGEAVEYFTTLPNGQAAVDNHLRLTLCESWVRPGGVHAHAMELDAAIVPKQGAWPAVPAGDNAVQIPFANAAARKAFLNGTLMPNRTLSMWYDYTYDNCHNPAQLPGCPAPPNHHELTFYAETLNPPAAAATWFTGPTRYCGP
jgi:hypothetical protein